MQVPNSEIRLNLMLAEAAQVYQGKMYALGVGLSAIVVSNPAAPTVMAICGTVTLPFPELHRPHKIEFELVSFDGRPYMIQTPVGDQPFVVNAVVTGALAPFMPRGIEVILPFAAQFILPNLRVGRYKFRTSLNGDEATYVALPLHLLSPAQAAGMPEPPSST